ncbi:MAG TPA: glycoside hydrolase family 88 protein [Chitinivibrionales bacterium]|nr:glycoside hydrolase family 88 protein [Chitinivibrionales bacterium]
MQSIIISIPLFLFIIVQIVFPQPEFSPDSIIKVCMRVADSRLTSRMDRGWQGGTYMDGVMAMYQMTKNAKYLDTAIAWGNYYQWMPNTDGNDVGNHGDTIKNNFDSWCCFHAYFEVFEQDTSPANFYRVKAATVASKYMAYVDPPPFGGNKNDPVWPIFDHLYMSAPALAYTGHVLHDTAMLDTIYSFYKNNADRHHYCARDSLWGSNVFNVCSTTPDIHYWAQGNGWVSGSLGLIHKNLPKGRAGTQWFESMIKAHITRLVEFQNDTDGLWRSDINHQSVYPSKETSGSVFFLYEILYAINNGIVDRNAFEGAAKKAWTGLLGCIGSDNHIGYAQGAWSSPGPVTAGDNNEWTDGGFCMAGNELYKLMASTSISVKPVATGVSGSSTRVRSLNSFGTGRIAVPVGARSLEIYNIRGRLVYEQMLDASGKQRFLTLPQTVSAAGALLVKFQNP